MKRRITERSFGSDLGRASPSADDRASSSRLGDEAARADREDPGHLPTRRHHARAAAASGPADSRTASTSASRRTTPRIRTRRSRRSSRCGRRTGAPNVLVILIDDAGFGSSSAFGGPCQTPNFERLAENGLRYNRFHTTALCSPTRQALLTGRNHHAVGMGGITEIATSAPGYNSIRPKAAAPLAETLKLNGYSTAQFGKCHEVPVWETSPMGPFDAWPSGGGGFEHFYGFIGGETNQYAPALYDGHGAGRARSHAGRGLPLHRGHDGSRDRLDPPAEGAHARQAVLRLLRAGSDTRAAPRCARVVGQVQGQVRPGLGQASARRRSRARRSSA